MLPQIHITTKKHPWKNIIGGHPVAQAKDFHQHHIWCFPLSCTGGRISFNAAPSLAVLFLGIGELGDGLGRHQLKGCQWERLLALYCSRVVIKSYMVTLKYDCRPTGSPTSLDQSAVNLTMLVRHWIRALSLVPDCCMLAFAALINALDLWALSVLWNGNAFFCHAIKLSSKANLKYLSSK